MTRITSPTKIRGLAPYLVQESHPAITIRTFGNSYRYEVPEDIELSDELKKRLTAPDIVVE